MAVNPAAIVKQPSCYKYKEDFDLFFRQFKTYVKNVDCKPDNQFDLLLSFLDSRSYQLVDAIIYTEEEKTEIARTIDSALPKLKKALTPPEKMPAKVELKFCKQVHESLSDFGFKIQTLGNRAFGTNSVTNGQVIDAFCLGVRSNELSARLLTQDFTSLQDAIAFALKKESSLNIKQYVADNRPAAGSSREISVLQVDGTQQEETVTNVSETFSRQQPGIPPPIDQKVESQKRYASDYNSRGESGRKIESQTRGLENIKCYICKNWGHYATSCKKRQNDKRCYNCGQYGHLMKTCLKQINSNRAPQPQQESNFRRGQGNQFKY